MTKEEKLTREVEVLKEAVRAFVRTCPDFREGDELARQIGVAMANMESTLHWQFSCWELALPSNITDPIAPK